VPLDRAEEARATMLDLFPEGFEEVELDGDLELAAYAHAGAEERFWQAFGPGAVADVPEDWSEAWKRFHRPVRVGPLWIGPPWEDPDTDAVAVVVDPGRAFGTGSHATTRLCLQMLADRSPTSLLDLGCGSGVLAIAAAKLGFAPVTGLDVDQDAVTATVANARANGVEIEARRADFLEDELPAADLTVANITLQAVEAVANRVIGDELIASGYLAAERPSLLGWAHRDRREGEGWAADAFVRS
jgi:ribosomal protein L11 methyltransferase